MRTDCRWHECECVQWTVALCETHLLLLDCAGKSRSLPCCVKCMVCLWSLQAQHIETLLTWLLMIHMNNTYLSNQHINVLLGCCSCKVWWWPWYSKNLPVVVLSGQLSNMANDSKYDTVLMFNLKTLISMLWKDRVKFFVVLISRQVLLLTELVERVPVLKCL